MNDDVFTPPKPLRKSKRQPNRNQRLTLKFHTNERAFSDLELEWKNLARISNQMICMSAGWAASWWKHFGKHKKRTLFIVTVRDNQKLVAIFPFYKGITNVGGVTIQKRLQLIGSGGSPNEQFGFSDDYGISDFLDLIVDPMYSGRVAKLFTKLLSSPPFSDHQITFHQARDDSYIMQHLCPLLKKEKCSLRAERTDICYYIEIDQQSDLKGFIKKSKSNARRRFRKTLRARGAENEFAIEEPASMTEVEKAIDKLIHLHQVKWTSIGYPGAFQDDRFREFFKEITFTAYRENRLWLKQAVDESGVCAVRMLLLYNGRYYDYMSGYNQESPSAKYRPGIGLLLELVEDSFKQPIERIELLRGDEGYKEDFTHLKLNNWEITIPEISSWKTGWRVPGRLIRYCSIFLKYFNREKMLLKIQRQKMGSLQMVPGYFKFRYNTLLNKLNG